MDDGHPIKILIKEFTYTFLYKNRHLLYTEEAAQYATPDLKVKNNRKQNHSSEPSFKKSKTHTNRKSLDKSGKEMVRFS